MVPTASIWDMLRWCIGAMGIWVVVSIPAYACLTVWLAVRHASAEALRTFYLFVLAVRDHRKLDAARRRQELKEAMRWYEVDSVSMKAWQDSVSGIFHEASTNARQLTGATEVGHQAVSMFETNLFAIKRIKVGEAAPAIPDVETALVNRGRQRVALFNFAAASFLLIPIFGMNAQMTGLVLSQVLPPLQPFFGLPVPFVIAIVLVLVEAGLGLMHSVEAESRVGTERTISAWSVVWTLAGLAVIVTEAMLYGLVNTESVLVIPVAGSVFGLIGALLGLVVFGLGRLWHSSFVTLKRERTPNALRKEFSRLRDVAEELNRAAEKCRPNYDRASAAFETLIALGRDAVSLQQESVGKVLSEIERQRGALPAWAAPKDREMSDAEFTEREARAYLWSFVWIVGTITLCGISGTFATRLPALTGAAIGLGVAIAAFAIGAFAAQDQVLGNTRRFILYGVLASVVIAGSMIEARFLRGAFTLHGTVLSAPALAVYVAGIQTGQSVMLLQLPVQMALSLIQMLALWTILTLASLMNVSTLIVTFVLRILAWPMVTIVSAFRKRDSPAHAGI